MDVGITASEDLIGQDHNEAGGHRSRPGVPLSKKTSDALVKLPHGILEEVVEHDGMSSVVMSGRMRAGAVKCGRIVYE